ncbi:hypothetical protein ACH4E7_39210 [Kitasatospora sp. NPDC018058]|uniref:WXG100-like domain-containing protein n=1 Tax=Kitasatospora sp. NPDC018058 TaxID=3364025 RepID=UPI0037BED381
MAIEIPPGFNGIARLAAGQDFPKPNEDQLMRMGAAWDDASKQLERIARSVDPVTARVLNGVRGATADEFRSFMGRLRRNIPEMSEGAAQIGKMSSETGLQVGYAKYMIIAQVVWLAYEITALVQSVYGAALIPAQVAAVRWNVQMILRRAFTSVVSAAVAQTAMDAAVQGIQFLMGARTEWDTNATIGAVEMGALSGAVAGPIGMAAEAVAPKIAHTFLGQAATHAVTGVSVAAVVNAAFDADQDLGLAAAAGAIGGAAGWRKGGHGPGPVEEIKGTQGIESPILRPEDIAGESAGTTAPAPEETSAVAGGGHPVEPPATVPALATDAPDAAPAAEGRPSPTVGETSPGRPDEVTGQPTAAGNPGAMAPSVAAEPPAAATERTAQTGTNAASPATRAAVAEPEATSSGRAVRGVAGTEAAAAPVSAGAVRALADSTGENARPAAEPVVRAVGLPGLESSGAHTAVSAAGPTAADARYAQDTAPSTHAPITTDTRTTTDAPPLTAERSPGERFHEAGAGAAGTDRAGTSAATVHPETGDVPGAVESRPHEWGEQPQARVPAGDVGPQAALPVPDRAAAAPELLANGEDVQRGGAVTSGQDSAHAAPAAPAPVSTGLRTESDPTVLTTDAPGRPRAESAGPEPITDHGTPARTTTATSTPEPTGVRTEADPTPRSGEGPGRPAAVVTERAVSQPAPGSGAGLHERTQAEVGTTAQPGPPDTDRTRPATAGGHDPAPAPEPDADPRPPRDDTPPPPQPKPHTPELVPAPERADPTPQQRTHWEQAQRNIHDDYDGRLDGASRTAAAEADVRARLDAAFTEWSLRLPADSPEHVAVAVRQRAGELVAAELADRPGERERILQDLPGRLEVAAFRDAAVRVAMERFDRVSDAWGRRLTGGGAPLGPELTPEAIDRARTRLSSVFRERAETAAAGTYRTPEDVRDGLASRTALGERRLDALTTELAADLDLRAAYESVTEGANRMIDRAAARWRAALDDAGATLLEQAGVAADAPFSDASLDLLRDRTRDRLGEEFSGVFGSADSAADFRGELTDAVAQWNARLARHAEELPRQFALQAAREAVITSTVDAVRAGAESWAERARSRLDADVVEALGLPQAVPEHLVDRIAAALADQADRQLRLTADTDPAGWRASFARLTEPDRIHDLLALQSARDHAVRTADSDARAGSAEPGTGRPLSGDSADRVRDGHTERIRAAFDEVFDGPDALRGDGLKERLDRWHERRQAIGAELADRLAFEAEVVPALEAAGRGFDALAAGRDLPERELLTLKEQFGEDWFTAYRDHWGPAGLDGDRWLAHDAAHEGRFLSSDARPTDAETVGGQLIRPRSQAPLEATVRPRPDEAHSDVLPAERVTRAARLPSDASQLPAMGANERGRFLVSLSDEQRRVVARDPGIVNGLRESLPPREFAGVAADLMVAVDPRTERPASARQEARDQLARMLQDPDVAQRLLLKGAGATVVPRQVPMTDVADFRHLAGRTAEGEAGAGRRWEDVRGSGGLRAAVTEENLLGERATVGDETPYPDGYSTTTHEFAHTLHDFGLNDADRELITRTYRAKTDLDHLTSVFGEQSPVAWSDGVRRVQGRDGDNYAARNEREYFAQVSNAYLGTNHGRDPYTGDMRNNGARWVRQNEPELLPLLERLYGGDPEAVHSALTNPVTDTARENRTLRAFREFMDGESLPPEQMPPGSPTDRPGGTPYALDERQHTAVTAPPPPPGEPSPHDDGTSPEHTADAPEESQEEADDEMYLPYRLSQLVDRRDWWVFFIDPVHHGTAYRKYPEDPGSYYDNDQSPGFRAGMLAAYDYILEHPERALDSTTYLELHQMIASRLRDDTPVKTGSLEGKVTKFPLRATKMSEDTARMYIGERRLLYDARTHDWTKPMTSDAKRAVSILAVPDGRSYEADPVTERPAREPVITVNYTGEDWHNLVDQIFADYQAEIQAAYEREEAADEHRNELLAAIARTVTKLQIMHPFTDGNRRLNVHVVLPKLLLDNDFWPVAATELREMFQGGRSTAEQVGILARALDRSVVRDEPDPTAPGASPAPVPAQPPAGPVAATGPGTRGPAWGDFEPNVPLARGVKPVDVVLSTLTNGPVNDADALATTLLPAVRSLRFGSYHLVLRAEEGLLGSEAVGLLKTLSQEHHIPADLLLADSDGQVHLHRFSADGGHEDLGPLQPGPGDSSPVDPLGEPVRNSDDGGDGGDRAGQNGDEGGSAGGRGDRSNDGREEPDGSRGDSVRDTGNGSDRPDQPVPGTDAPPARPDTDGTARPDAPRRRRPDAAAPVRSVRTQDGVPSPAARPVEPSGLRQQASHQMRQLALTESWVSPGAHERHALDAVARRLFDMADGALVPLGRRRDLVSVGAILRTLGQPVTLDRLTTARALHTLFPPRYRSVSGPEGLDHLAAEVAGSSGRSVRRPPATFERRTLFNRASTLLTHGRPVTVDYLRAAGLVQRTADRDFGADADRPVDRVNRLARTVFRLAEGAKVQKSERARLLDAAADSAGRADWLRALRQQLPVGDGRPTDRPGSELPLLPDRSLDLRLFTDGPESEEPLLRHDPDGPESGAPSRLHDPLSGDR